MSRHSFSMRDRQPRQGDYDQLIEELVKLIPLAVLLASMYARPWIEHQAWRIRTHAERNKRAASLARLQVKREISWLEHDTYPLPPEPSDEDPLVR